MSKKSFSIVSKILGSPSQSVSKVESTQPPTKAAVVNPNHCKTHNKESNIFCLECKLKICISCLKEHKGHDFEEIEENDNRSNNINLQEKSLAVMKDIRLKLDVLNVEKVKEADRFDNDIKNVYQNDKQFFSDFFRETHDSLHIKEVELKREIESYYNDNEESFVKFASTLDSQIGELNEYLKLLSDLNEANDVEEETMTDIFKTVDLKLKTTSPVNKYYTREIDKNSINRFKDSIQTKLHLDVDTHIFFVYSQDDGFSKLDILSKKVTHLLPPDNRIKVYANYQNNTINGKLHYILFTRDMFVIKNNTYEYMKQDIPYSPSTIYDGKDHIYLFGGNKTNEPAVNEIYKLNIKTNEVKLVPTKLPVALNGISLSRDGDIIYLISGEYINKTISTNIYKFDLPTESFQLVTDNAYGFKPTQVKQSGYCIAKTNSIYLFNDGEMIQIDMNTKKEIFKISIPSHQKHYYYKTLYDHKDILYFYPTLLSITFVFSFNIQTRQMQQIKLPKEIKNGILFMQ